jgi:hypothetical protein
LAKRAKSPADLLSLAQTRAPTRNQ